MKQMIKYLDSPLGQGISFAPAKKEWIAAAIGAGVGLASSLIGGAAASRAAKEAERRQRAREAAEMASYTRRYNQDVTDTASGQNLIRIAKDQAKEQWKKAAGAQAVAGGTDAATQMAKDAGNKMVGDTIANMKAMDDARKDRIDAQHEANLNNFAQMDMEREINRANAITDAAGNASNAILQAASALEPDLTGGANKSKVKA